MTSSLDELCASRAGPFRNIRDDNISFAIYFALSVASIFINAGMRYLVLGYCMNNLPPATKDQPTTALCSRCQQTNIPPGDNALPPPYSESESLTGSKAKAEERAAAETKAAMAHRPSIARFSLCTALAIINILTMVLIAFSLQSGLYCPIHSNNKVDSSTQFVSQVVVFWIIYVISAAWALSGTLCWVIWLRNLLGGPESAERWPILPAIGLYVLCAAFISPLMILFGVVGLSAWLVVKLVRFVVKGVKGGVLRLFCGKPSEEKESIEMEGRATEMEEGCGNGDVIMGNAGGEEISGRDGNQRTWMGKMVPV
ncbi:hypothetical protein OIDMADRAFT_60672 [Oidiodendron maius Zn]|uniref:Uncharacterized protein n=1 Tax=Oidiodendron maius (strain Zn) TaxID=913774 RepID=A0A0C3CXB6_OIDMZ|nr:hypothetical protein OIDMADRAFT_60672 [Oidiodendron maius Zn]